MPRTRYSTEQIVTKLRQAEVELGRGLRVPQMCKKLGISEQTYYRWRKEYGGLRLDQAKRLKELERENIRLKKLVADQALDTAILKEAASGNCGARTGDVKPWTMSAHGWASPSGGPVASSATRARPTGTGRTCRMTNRGW
jgi:transposase-like protein